MDFQIRVLITSLLVVVASASADTAAAAVLLPDLEAVLANDDSNDRVASARSTVPLAPPDESDQSPSRIEQALVALPSSPVNSTGASTVVTSSPPISAALAAVVRIDGVLLVDYLSRESRMLLPVPFLSGVFRPPRAIG
ncbi:MAG: hypothetical protein WBC44_08240 [Planctomycetaceae bacterium]